MLTSEAAVLLGTLKYLPQNKDTICSDAVNLIFNPLLKYLRATTKVAKLKEVQQNCKIVIFYLTILIAVLGYEARKWQNT